MCGEDDEVEFRECEEYHIRNMARFLRLDQTYLRNIYTVERLGPVGVKPWNPYLGKCTAIVRFLSNRPISIVSYGFFGPLQINIYGKYHMEIELLTNEFLSIAKANVVTPIQKGSGKFHVKFDCPIPILPCTWYNAKFSLLGPPTGQSLKICSKKRIQCGDENITFKFEEPDSNQLPEISFMLRF